jgi:hypothetical protein
VHDFRSFFLLEKRDKVSFGDMMAPGANYSAHGSRIIRVYFTWQDNEYRNFMIGALSALEPIFYNASTKIYRE